MSTPVFPTNPQDGEEFTALENGVTYVYDASSNSWSVGELLGDAQLLPDIKPSLDLDFANTKSLDPRIDFTRATTGTYYDGETFAKAEENLLLYSQEFDNGVWGKVNTSVTADSGTSPDGSQTADTINFNGNGTDSVIFGTDFDIESSKTYAISVFVKYIDQQWIQIHGSSTRWNDYRANFDVQNGTVGDVSGYQSSQIIDVGNGWYRLSVIGSPDSSGTTAAPMAISGVDNSSSTRAESLSASNTSAFIWGAQFEERSQVTAYTPTTDQPVTRYQPVLQTATADRPRFDHDPVTGESKGLLIEEGRTNTTPYSQSFDDANSSWRPSRLSAYNRNAAVGPDGTITALQIKEDTQNGSHYIQYNDSYNSGQVYTWSGYLKADGRNHGIITLHQDAFGNQINVLFDLTDGSASVIQGSPDSFQSENAGNGWYRCSVTATATTDNNSVRTRFMISDGSNNNSYQGDGFSGILVWGAQLEEGSFPTSYIKTEGSQVTRVADSASITGENFSEWYRQDEGSMFFEGQNLRIGNGSVAFDLSDSDDISSSNRIFMNTFNGYQGFVRYNESTQAIIDAGQPEQGLHKIIFGFAKNDFSVSVDGGNVSTDSDGIMPTTIDRLQIGPTEDEQNILIKRLTYYPKRLPNAVLQTLTEE